jgi:16S rRNA (guanine527-N7)-methyltransferase
MDSIQQHFVSLLAEKNIPVSAVQLDQFETYYQELVVWNEKMNLTGITDREQVYLKHFYDSLSISFFLPFGKVKTLADIGSGAGFPSVPLKIVFPALELTIVDSLQKRIHFLNHICEQLNLQNVTCLHSRAEDAARLSNHRDRYDLVTARAVAKLAVLNEFCLPFVKKGGLFVAMKGQDISTELEEANFSLRELKGKVNDVHFLRLPGDESERHIIIISKLDPTPKKYPRKAGLPLKSPLIV